MSNSFFRFKKFTVWHDKCAMKVGTDGVLLGAWCDVKGKKRALDIGTGTGLIAMMMVQRNDKLHVHAIDIDGKAVEQATENVRQSPFNKNISVSELDFNKFETEKEEQFDLIVSNPPFFSEEVYSYDSRRNDSRHTSSLPFDVLIERSATLLSDNGEFNVIIPFKEVNPFIATAARYGLYLLRKTDVKTSPNKQIKRTMLAFKKGFCNAVHDVICIMENGAYSKEYVALTEDFYL